MRRLLAALAIGLTLACGAAAGGFSLTSPDLGPARRFGARQVLNIHGCTGGDVSPALRWRGAPKGTRGFALTVFDRDARGGLGWWHWVVLDLPASAHGLVAGAGAAGGHGLPGGARNGPTSFGFAAYGGPCPPPGAPHHYVFTLYALKVARLRGPIGRDPAKLAAALRAASLGRASMVATYARVASAH